MERVLIIDPKFKTKEIVKKKLNLAYKCKFFREFISPVKLNLFLEVINKTSDGYHELESLMIFCKFGDLIKIKKSNKFLFSIEGPFSKNLSTNQNIIIDTVSLLENFFDTKFNIEIVLKKNLPISSGMGGDHQIC